MEDLKLEKAKIKKSFILHDSIYLAFLRTQIILAFLQTQNRSDRKQTNGNTGGGGQCLGRNMTQFLSVGEVLYLAISGSHKTEYI